MYDIVKTLQIGAKQIGLEIQQKSSSMTGTELNTEKDYIPDFVEAIKTKNMLDRHAGMKDGFVCKSSAGRVVRLLQNYDSVIYTDEPEDLSAQWGFVWSTNPEHALPFIKIATSPYNIDNVCKFDNKIYRSLIDNNVYSPSEYPKGWKIV